MEIAKRLKKRELECSALWETLRDMYNGNQQVYDTRQMLDVLAIRALDVKAKKKLGLNSGITNGASAGQVTRKR